MNHIFTVKFSHSSNLQWVKYLIFFLCLKAYRVLKSVNLQYNTLGRLDVGTNESSTKSLMFQVFFFFVISCKILYKNPFNLFSYFFYKITKIKIKSFECPKSIKSIKKIILGTSDSWSTIRLSHRPSNPA